MQKSIYWGFGLLVLLLGVGYVLTPSIELFYRWTIGLGFGYALVRASMGFAGGVNRLVRANSATLAQSLMVLFVVTAVLTSFIIYGNESAYDLSIYPINSALIMGGVLFGVGMALSSCCATGSLTDLSSGFSRAAVTIFFFGMGVFAGFGVQQSSFVTASWVTSSTGAAHKGGLFLPDIFSAFSPLGSYIMALVVTALLASLVGYLAHRYARQNATSTPAPTASTPPSLAVRLFVAPWAMRVSILIIALLFGALLFFYAKGWSASSAFGLWFGKLLLLVGVDAQTLSAFTHKSATFFTTPLWSHGTSIQNFGIIMGAVLYLTMAGTFATKFRASLRLSMKDVAVFAAGGLLMGFGTRLSNGCNVGALYTPIAELSLSGWVYLVVVVTGGFVGNWLSSRYIYPTCKV
ncbi:MAG: hypothetical protein KU37_04885 [Sulfuricurvum sp. PC08-66]|nr:MAG: hypothetical protein KU37_04885 [Sulfuricurvum sp. PC08-66]